MDCKVAISYTFKVKIYMYIKGFAFKIYWLNSVFKLSINNNATNNSINIIILEYLCPISLKTDMIYSSQTFELTSTYLAKS